MVKGPEDINRELAADREEARRLIREAALRHKLDPDLLEAVAFQESGLNRNARSPMGALGVAQFMEETGRRYGLNNDNDRRDPVKSADAMARHWRDNLERYDGDIDLAAVAYNAGAGTADKVVRARRAGREHPLPKETREYIPAIRSYYDAIKGTTAPKERDPFADPAMQRGPNRSVRPAAPPKPVVMPPPVQAAPDVAMPAAPVVEPRSSFEAAYAPKARGPMADEAPTGPGPVSPVRPVMPAPVQGATGIPAPPPDPLAGQQAAAPQRRRMVRRRPAGPSLTPEMRGALGIAKTLGGLFDPRGRKGYGWQPVKADPAAGRSTITPTPEESTGSQNVNPLMAAMSPGFYEGPSVSETRQPLPRRSFAPAPQRGPGSVFAAQSEGLDRPEPEAPASTLPRRRGLIAPSASNPLAVNSRAFARPIKPTPAEFGAVERPADAPRPQVSAPQSGPGARFAQDAAEVLRPKSDEEKMREYRDEVIYRHLNYGSKAEEYAKRRHTAPPGVIPEGYFGARDANESWTNWLLRKGDEMIVGGGEPSGPVLDQATRTEVNKLSDADWEHSRLGQASDVFNKLAMPWASLPLAANAQMQRQFNRPYMQQGFRNLGAGENIARGLANTMGQVAAGSSFNYLKPNEALEQKANPDAPFPGAVEAINQGANMVGLAPASVALMYGGGALAGAAGLTGIGAEMAGGLTALGAQELLSDQPPGLPYRETLGERGMRGLRGAAMGAAFPIVNRALAPVLNPLVRAGERAISRSAARPILEPLALPSRGGSGATMFTTAYPVAYAFGDPMPDAGQNLQNTILGVFTGPEANRYTAAHVGTPYQRPVAVPKGTPPVVFVSPDGRTGVFESPNRPGASAQWRTIDGPVEAPDSNVVNLREGQFEQLFPDHRDGATAAIRERTRLLIEQHRAARVATGMEQTRAAEAAEDAPAGADPALSPDVAASRPILPEATAESAPVESDGINSEIALAESEPALRGREKAIALADQMEADARQSLRERFGDMRSGFDPGMVVDLAKIVAAKILRRGSSSKALDWVVEMVEEFGDAIRPHVEAIGAKASEMVERERARLEADHDAARREFDERQSVEIETTFEGQPVTQRIPRSDPYDPVALESLRPYTNPRGATVEPFLEGGGMRLTPEAAPTRAEAETTGARSTPAESDPATPPKIKKYSDGLARWSKGRGGVGTLDADAKREWLREFGLESNDTGRRIRYEYELSDGRVVSAESALKATNPKAYDAIKARHASLTKASARFDIFRALPEDVRQQMIDELPYTEMAAGRRKGEQAGETIDRFLKAEGHLLADVWGRDKGPGAEIMTRFELAERLPDLVRPSAEEAAGNYLSRNKQADKPVVYTRDDQFVAVHQNGPFRKGLEAEGWTPVAPTVARQAFDALQNTERGATSDAIREGQSDVAKPEQAQPVSRDARGDVVDGGESGGVRTRPPGTIGTDRVWGNGERLTRADLSESQRRAADPANPATKRFLRKSVALDAGGLPILLYHGTKRLIERFDPAFAGFSRYQGSFHSVAPAVGQHYAGADGHVYVSIMRAEKPFDMTTTHDYASLRSIDPEAALIAARMANVTDANTPIPATNFYDALRVVHAERLGTDHLPSVINAATQSLKDAGFDSIHYRFTAGDPRDADVWVALDKGQVLHLDDPELAGDAVAEQRRPADLDPDEDAAITNIRRRRGLPESEKRQTTRDDMVEGFVRDSGVSRREAESVVAVIDAVADAWSAVNGKPASEYYATRYGGTERGQGGQAAAQVRFLADGRAIIRAFGKRTNVSGLVHEVAHIFRRDLAGDLLRAAEDWAGVKDGNWTATAEEKFARAFERYIRRGQAPTEGLRKVFDDLSTWFREIYRSIKGGPLDLGITPELQRVFDTILNPEASRTDSSAEARRALEAQGAAARTRGVTDLDQLPVFARDPKALPEVDNVVDLPAKMGFKARGELPAKLDTLREQFPNVLRSAQEWRKFYAAMGAKAAPLVPLNALTYVRNPAKLVELLRTMQNADGSWNEQVRRADAGFKAAARWSAAYADGRLQPRHTAKIFLWGILSRKLSPFPHENAFVHASTQGIDRFIEDALNGTFDIAAYDAWSKDASPLAGTEGAGAQNNLNDYGKYFLAKMAERVTDGPYEGKTKLAVLHELMKDSSLSGREVRRRFHMLVDGAGIDNKVVSFALLATGRTDVLVLDRVQLNHLFAAETQFAQTGVWDGYDKDGNKKYITVNAYDGLPTGTVAKPEEVFVPPHIQALLDRVAEPSGVLVKAENLLGRKGTDNAKLKTVRELLEKAAKEGPLEGHAAEVDAIVKSDIDVAAKLAAIQTLADVNRKPPSTLTDVARLKKAVDRENTRRADILDDLKLREREAKKQADLHEREAKAAAAKAIELSRELSPEEIADRQTKRKALIEKRAEAQEQVRKLAAKVERSQDAESRAAVEKQLAAAQAREKKLGKSIRDLFNETNASARAKGAETARAREKAELAAQREQQALSADLAKKTDTKGRANNDLTPIELRSTGLWEVGSSTRGLAVYEALEDALAGAGQQAYDAVGRGADFSLARLHWETWVARSKQEVDHGSLPFILNEADGKADPYAGAAVEQGKYDTYKSGVRSVYMGEGGGTIFVARSSDGTAHVLDGPAYDRWQAAVKKAGDSGQFVDKEAPDGRFRVSKQDAKWIHDPANAGLYDRLLGEFGRRPTGRELVHIQSPDGPGLGGKLPDAGRVPDDARGVTEAPSLSGRVRDGAADLRASGEESGAAALSRLKGRSKDRATGRKAGAGVDASEIAADMADLVALGQARAKRGVSTLMDWTASLLDVLERQVGKEYAEAVRPFATEIYDRMHGAHKDPGAPPIEKERVVAYHGGSQFKDGVPRVPFFSTPNRVASEYYAHEQGGDAPTIHEVEVTLKKPLDTRSKVGEQEYLSIIEKAGVTTKQTKWGEVYTPEIEGHQVWVDGEGGLQDLTYIPQVREALKAAGYDGLIVNDLFGNGEITAYIAIDPKQVRVADSRGANPNVESLEDFPKLKARAEAPKKTTPLPANWKQKRGRINFALKKSGVNGDRLANALDLADELAGRGGQVSQSGVVRLYHRTTPGAARSIVESGEMSAKEDQVYFSTKADGAISEYGEAVVEVDVPLTSLNLEDVFDGEAHVTIRTGAPGKSVKVRTKPENPDAVAYEASKADIVRKRREQYEADKAARQSSPGGDRLIAIMPNMTPQQKLRAMEANASARAKAALKKLRSTTSAGVDPTLIKDIAVAAGWKMLRSGHDASMKFVDFSKMMIEEFGAVVEPHLRKAYTEAKKFLKERGPEFEKEYGTRFIGDDQNWNVGTAVDNIRKHIREGKTEEDVMAAIDREGLLGGSPSLRQQAETVIGDMFFEKGGESGPALRRRLTELLREGHDLKKAQKNAPLEFKPKDENGAWRMEDGRWVRNEPWWAAREESTRESLKAHEAKQRARDQKERGPVEMSFGLAAAGNAEVTYENWMKMFRESNTNPASELLEAADADLLSDEQQAILEKAIDDIDRSSGDINEISKIVREALGQVYPDHPLDGKGKSLNGPVIDWESVGARPKVSLPDIVEHEVNAVAGDDKAPPLRFFESTYDGFPGELAVVTLEGSSTENLVYRVVEGTDPILKKASDGEYWELHTPESVEIYSDRAEALEYAQEAADRMVKNAPDAEGNLPEAAVEALDSVRRAFEGDLGSDQIRRHRVMKLFENVGKGENAKEYFDYVHGLDEIDADLAYDRVADDLDEGRTNEEIVDAFNVDFTDAERESLLDGLETVREAIEDGKDTFSAVALLEPTLKTVFGKTRNARPKITVSSEKVTKEAAAKPLGPIEGDRVEMDADGALEQIYDDIFDSNRDNEQIFDALGIDFTDFERKTLTTAIEKARKAYDNTDSADPDGDVARKLEPAVKRIFREPRQRNEVNVPLPYSDEGRGRPIGKQGESLAPIDMAEVNRILDQGEKNLRKPRPVPPVKGDARTLEQMKADRDAFMASRPKSAEPSEFEKRLAKNKEREKTPSDKEALAKFAADIIAADPSITRTKFVKRMERQFGTRITFAAAEMFSAAEKRMQELREAKDFDRLGGKPGDTLDYSGKYPTMIRKRTEMNAPPLTQDGIRKALEDNARVQRQDAEALPPPNEAALRGVAEHATQILARDLTMSRADLAKELLDVYGEPIRPHIGEMYDAAKKAQAEVTKRLEGEKPLLPIHEMTFDEYAAPERLKEYPKRQQRAIRAEYEYFVRQAHLSGEIIPPRVLANLSRPIKPRKIDTARKARNQADRIRDNLVHPAREVYQRAVERHGPDHPRAIEAATRLRDVEHSLSLANQEAARLAREEWALQKRSVEEKREQQAEAKIAKMKAEIDAESRRDRSHLPAGPQKNEPVGVVTRRKEIAKLEAKLPQKVHAGEDVPALRFASPRDLIGYLGDGPGERPIGEVARVAVIGGRASEGPATFHVYPDNEPVTGTKRWALESMWGRETFPTEAAAKAEAQRQADALGKELAVPDKTTPQEKLKAFEERTMEGVKAQLRLVAKGEQQNALLPANVIADLVAVGAAKLLRHGYDFVEFSRAMVKEFGDTVGPDMREIFDGARRKAKELEGLGVFEHLPDEDFREEGELHWNPRTSGLPDEYRNEFNRRIVENRPPEGYPAETVEPLAVVEEAARLVGPELVAHLGTWKKGEAVPPVEVVLQAKNYAESLSRQADDLYQRIDNGVDFDGDPLTSTDRDAMLARAEELEAAAVKVIQSVIPIKTQMGRALSALRIKVNSGMSAERGIQMARRLAKTVGHDVTTKRWADTEAEIARVAAKDGRAGEKVTALETVLRNAGVDPGRLVGKNGEPVSSTDAQRVFREIFGKAATTKKVEKTIRPFAEELKDRAIKRQAEGWAQLKQLRADLAGGKLSSGPGVPAEFLEPIAKIVSGWLTEKAITRAEIAKRLVAEFGEEIRPQIDRLRARAFRMNSEDRRALRRERDIERLTEGDPDQYSADEIEDMLASLEEERAADKRRVRDLHRVTPDAADPRTHANKIGEIPVGPAGAGHKFTAARGTYQAKLQAAAADAQKRLANPDWARTDEALDDVAAVGAAKLIEPGMTRERWNKEMATEFGEAYTSRRKDVFAATSHYFNEARDLDRTRQTERAATAGKGDLTPEETAKAVREFLNAKKEQSAARRDLFAALNSVQNQTLADQALLIRKAGLLTGFKTSVRNLVGTAGFAIVQEEVARIPSAMVDAAIGAFTGRRTVTGPDFEAMWRAGRQMATKGVEEAISIMKNGATQEQMDRLEVSRELASKSKLLNAYVNGVFRLMSAQDRMMKVYVIHRSLEGYAKAQALTEAKQRTLPKNAEGKLLTVAERAAQLVANPTENLMADAIAEADFATFNTDNALSNAYQAGRTKLRAGGMAGRGIAAAADLTMPFVRTPTNILARIIDYSPLGVGVTIADPIYNIIKEKQAGVDDGIFTPARQQAFARGIGRASVGTAIILIGGELFKLGILSGSRDDDDSKRNRDITTGRQPMSIKIGGDWHNIGTLSPFGNLLTMGATLQREHDQIRRDPSVATQRMISAAANTVIEQPMLKGTKDVIEALSRPGTAGSRMTGAIAGSIVPTLVSDVSSMIDTKRRDNRGIVENLLGRTPGRVLLPEAYDALGRDAEHRRSNAWNAFVPTKARGDSDPVDHELERLDVGLPRVKQVLGEPEATYRERDREIGRERYRRIAAAVSDPAYKALPREQQKIVVETAIREAAQTTNEMYKAKGVAIPADLAP